MAPKIVNIEHDDKISYLIELIESSEADEFFFVVPKSHKVFLDQETSQLLAEKANALNKTITIITSDQRIVDTATEVGFKVLEEHKRSATVQSKQKKHDKTYLKEIVAQKPDEITSVDIKDLPDEKEEIPISENTDEITENPVQEKIISQNNETAFPIKYYRAEEELEKLYNPHRASPEKLKPIQEVIRPLKQKNINFQTKKFPKKVLYAIFCAFILVVIFAVLNGNQTAKITIIPQKEKATLNLSLTASENPANQSELTGQLIEIQKTINQTADSSGNKFLEQKATGLITIYNSFSSAPQTLVATTRFQTKEGLIFRTTKTVTVPGAQLENGILIPGNIETDVVADKAGTNYNIEPARFSVPGFIGTSKYDKFYAESKSAMKNGFTGKTKYATKEDIEKVQTELTSQLKSELTKELSKLKENELIINVESAKTTIQMTENSAKENTIGEKFTVELSGKLSVMGINKQEIETNINNYLSQKGTAKKFIPSSLEYSIIPQKLDLERKKLTFELNAKLEATANIDTQKIKKEIGGFNEAQISSYFKNISTVEKVKILISPFWKRSIPQNMSKITVEVANP